MEFFPKQNIDRQLLSIKRLRVMDGEDYVHIEDDVADIVWLNGDDSGLYGNGFFEQVSIDLTEENLKDLQEADELCEAHCIESTPHYCTDIGDGFLADDILTLISSGYYKLAVDGRQYILNHAKQAEQNPVM